MLPKPYVAFLGHPLSGTMCMYVCNISTCVVLVWDWQLDRCVAPVLTISPDMFWAFSLPRSSSESSLMTY